MRRSGLVAVLQLGATGAVAVAALPLSACQLLLDFTGRDSSTVFVVVGPDGSSTAPGAEGGVVAEGGSISNVDAGSSSFRSCANPPPRTVYCADFNDGTLAHYGNFGTGYALEAGGGVDGTARLSMELDIAQQVDLKDVSAIAAGWSALRVEAEVACTAVADATTTFESNKLDVGLFGFMASTGPSAVVTCSRPGGRDTPLQLSVVLIDRGTSNVYDTLKLSDISSADGTLQHVAFKIQNTASAGSPMVLVTADDGRKISAPGTLNAMQLATAGLAQDVHGYIDNLVVTTE